jgi:hypothetical protein
VVVFGRGQKNCRFHVRLIDLLPIVVKRTLLAICAPPFALNCDYLNVLNHSAVRDAELSKFTSLFSLSATFVCHAVDVVLTVSFSLTGFHFEASLAHFP